MQLPDFQHSELSSRQKIGELKALGYKTLGSGSWGTALMHRRNRHEVIKIGEVACAADQAITKDGYIAYISQVHGDNRHMPRIHEITMFEHDDRWFIVRMERLYKWNKAPKVAKKAALELFAVESLCQIGTEYQGKVRDAQARQISKLIGTTLENDSSLVLDIDEQNDNVMWRIENDKYTMVITDPFC